MSIIGRLLCNPQFADNINLLGGSEEEFQQSTESLEKTADGYGMEISSNKSKILVNSIKPRPSTNIRMNGKKAGRSGPVQIFRILTNQRWHINKGSKDQTGAGTLSHDKDSNTMTEKKAAGFSTFPLQITCTVSTALWM